MSRLLSKVWKPALSLLLALAVFLFWWKRYPHALAFQEQFQLFLFDTDYLMSRLGEPGGVARYLGEMLVQFYNLVPVGALINALLFCRDAVAYLAAHAAGGRLLVRTEFPAAGDVLGTTGR